MNTEQKEYVSVSRANPFFFSFLFDFFGPHLVVIKDHSSWDTEESNRLLGKMKDGEDDHMIWVAESRASIVLCVRQGALPLYYLSRPRK